MQDKIQAGTLDKGFLPAYNDNGVEHITHYFFILA